MCLNLGGSLKSWGALCCCQEVFFLVLGEPVTLCSLGIVQLQGTRHAADFPYSLSSHFHPLEKEAPPKIPQLPFSLTSSSQSFVASRPSESL